MLYQVLARDSVIKIRCHNVPFRGYSFIICRRRKNKADHYSSHLLSCIVNAPNKYHAIMVMVTLVIIIVIVNLVMIMVMVNIMVMVMVKIVIVIR